MKEFKVQFRTCNPYWAEEHDLPAEWDAVPWNAHLTARVTADGDSAREQYGVLSVWEQTKSQPVKDVQLFVREVPDADSGWEPA